MVFSRPFLLVKSLIGRLQKLFRRRDIIFQHRSKTKAEPQRNFFFLPLHRLLDLAKPLNDGVVPYLVAPAKPEFSPAKVAQGLH